MKLRTPSASALDRPGLWHKNLRPWFNAERYQAQLDEAVGLNRDGLSIIRLAWAQEVTTTAFGETTPRYWTKRQRAPGGWKWWTVPRWVLEKRLEPAQYTASWEASRYSLVDPSQGHNHYCEDCGRIGEPEIIAGQMYCRECASRRIAGGAVVDKGPPPTEWFTFAYLCAEHESIDQASGWAHCCLRAYYTDRSRCWGKYRQPSEDDLQLVRQAVRQMEASKWVDPYAPLTIQQLEEAEFNANMQVAEADAQLAEMQAAMAKDFYRLHGHRIFEGPDSFHDMSRTPIVVP